MRGFCLEKKGKTTRFLVFVLCCWCVLKLFLFICCFWYALRESVAYCCCFSTFSFKNDVLRWMMIANKDDVLRWMIHFFVRGGGGGGY